MNDQLIGMANDSAAPYVAIHCANIVLSDTRNKNGKHNNLEVTFFSEVLRQRNLLICCVSEHSQLGQRFIVE